MIDLFVEWYFFDLPRGIGRVWYNYLWFFEKFFAIKSLMGEFLAPWKGLTFKRQNPGLDPGDAISAALSNLISVILGAIVRAVFILFALACEAGVVVAGVMAYTAWIVALPAIVGALCFGLVLIL